MDDTQGELFRQTGEIPRAVVTDNNEPRRMGRRSLADNEMRSKGLEVRHRLTVKLAAHDMARPMQHDMQYNTHGNIYIS